MVRKIVVTFVLIIYTAVMGTVCVLNAQELLYIQDTTYPGEQKVLVHQISIKLTPLEGVQFDIPYGWFVVDSHIVTFNDRLLVVMVIEKAMTNRQRKEKAIGR